MLSLVSLIHNNKLASDEIHDPLENTLKLIHLLPMRSQSRVRVSIRRFQKGYDTTKFSIYQSSSIVRFT